MNHEKIKRVGIAISKFIIPFFIGIGIYALLGFVLVSIGQQTTWAILWPLVLAYFFPPFGKETVIPLGVGLLERGLDVPFINLHIVGGQIDPILMALSIAFVDIVVALFLLWNYDLAKKIPLIGPFIKKVEQKGKLSEEKYGWVKPLRFIGIMLFVMVPFQGSGGLVGSIVGRLIGMKPLNTFYAISLGAIIGCLLIAFFAQTFLIFVDINATLTLVLVVIILIIVGIYFLKKRRKRKTIN